MAGKGKKPEGGVDWGSKHIGYAYNDGGGGCSRFTPVGKHLSMWIDEAQKFVLDLPPQDLGDGYNFKLSFEDYLDDLAQQKIEKQSKDKEV